MKEVHGARLQKNLGFSHGLALYLAAVLGTGILHILVRDYCSAISHLSRARKSLESQSDP